MDIARGNNIILKLSTATYELVRTALPNFFHRYTNYSAIAETVKGENDLLLLLLDVLLLRLLTVVAGGIVIAFVHYCCWMYCYCVCSLYHHYYSLYK
jgi:hypothetical protein